MKKKRFINFPDFIAKIYPHDKEKTGFRGSSIKRELTRSVTFQVTDACNLACTYCYQTNKGTRVMSFETAKMFVDLLLSGDKGFHDYVNPEVSEGIVIEFIGGEPFLQIELIDQIVDYLRRRMIVEHHPWQEKFCISICSNGVLYRDEKVQQFLQKNYDCISFSVTVDGNQELHDACRVFPDGTGSYSLAEDAAMDWMHRGYYMGSKITIAPENLQYLFTAFRHFVELGYEEINANCVYEANWTVEQAGELYKQMKLMADFLLSSDEYARIYCSLFQRIVGKPMDDTDIQNWCGGTGAMLACDPDGNLFPCIRYMESSLNGEREPFCIGDIHSGLMLLPEHVQRVKCLDCVTRRTQSTDECFYCPIASGCSWCSAWNYQVFGTADKRCIDICCMHKARSLANAYFWNKYDEKYGRDEDEEAVNLWLPEQAAVAIIGAEEYSSLRELVLSCGGFVNKELIKTNGESEKELIAKVTKK